MESVQAFAAVREIDFEAEALDGLLDPERGLGGSPGCDLQRHGAAPIQRLGRQDFEARDAGAQAHGQLASPVGILVRGKRQELAQVTAASQVERVPVPGQPFDLGLRPLEPGAAPRCRQGQSLVAGKVAVVVDGRWLQQASVDLRVGIQGGVEGAPVRGALLPAVRMTGARMRAPSTIADRGCRPSPHLHDSRGSSGCRTGCRPARRAARGR